MGVTAPSVDKVGLEQVCPESVTEVSQPRAPTLPALEMLGVGCGFLAHSGAHEAQQLSGVVPASLMAWQGPGEGLRAEGGEAESQACCCQPHN